MIVYRLAKALYKNDLSGKGAELFGGRWNSKGIPMLYTCQSRALCTTEIAVHTPLGIIPKDYYLITIEIPDSVIIKEIAQTDLPSDWKCYPHSHSTQTIGDNFIMANSDLVLKVPSAVVQGESNFLLNPLHGGINKVKLQNTEPFEFDERLFRR